MVTSQLSFILTYPPPPPPPPPIPYQRSAFWPKTVWEPQVSTPEAAFYVSIPPRLMDLRKPANKEFAVRTLHLLVADALRHVPACLTYLSLLETPQVFAFCAVPQLMAIATLADVYVRAPLVFTGVVKIRRGLAARLFLEGIDASMSGTVEWYEHFLKIITDASDLNDSADKEVLKAIKKLKAPLAKAARDAKKA